MHRETLIILLFINRLNYCLSRSLPLIYIPKIEPVNLLKKTHLIEHFVTMLLRIFLIDNLHISTINSNTTIQSVCQNKGVSSMIDVSLSIRSPANKGDKFVGIFSHQNAWQRCNLASHVIYGRSLIGPFLKGISCGQCGIRQTGMSAQQCINFFCITLNI